MDPAPGVFLVATNALTDPHFRRSVVYLAEHTAQGSLGFIINRPLDIPLGDLWSDCPDSLRRALIAAEGGPVEPGRGLLMHLDSALPDGVAMGNGLFAGGSLPHLIAQWKNGPDARGPRLFLGHSGWNSDQLRSEIAEQAWLVRPGDLALALNPSTGRDGDRLWQRLSGLGGLPEPSLN